MSEVLWMRRCSIVTDGLVPRGARRLGAGSQQVAQRTEIDVQITRP